MKQLLLYGIVACCSISGMEEFNTIKILLDEPSKLTLYLESQDQYSRTPLMRLLDNGTDAMLEEVLPPLKCCKFDREIPGPANETAYFNACDRKTITGAVLMTYIGAKIDTATSAGRPIDMAFYNDNVPLLEYLLYEGQKGSQVPKVTHDFALKFPDFGEFKRVLDLKKRTIPSFAQKLLLKVIGSKITKKAVKKR